MQPQPVKRLTKLSRHHLLKNLSFRVTITSVQGPVLSCNLNCDFFLTQLPVSRTSWKEALLHIQAAGPHN